MHTMFFATKRADQAVLARLRLWLAPFDITPARYDMLYVISKTNAWMKRRDHFVFQSTIRRQLGVTAPVVSKMLRALQALGYVRRERIWHNDRRQVMVELTRKARGLLRKVHLRLIKPGCIWLAIYTVFAMDSEDIGLLKAHLDKLRDRFGDKARFDYPWCERTLKPHPRRKPARSVWDVMQELKAAAVKTPADASSSPGRGEPEPA